MDYLPLVLLVLVVVGAAAVFPFMRRLKRAAEATLEASRTLDAQLRSFQAQQAEQAQQAQQAQQADGSPPRGASGSPGDHERAPGTEPGA